MPNYKLSRRVIHLDIGIRYYLKSKKKPVTSFVGYPDQILPGLSI